MMMMHRRPVSLRRQHGVVLFIALIVLVAMALAGIAMMRSVDTALGVAGNLAFRQASVQATERGVSAAYAYLSGTSGSTLNSDDPANGYQAELASDSNWFDPANWGSAVDVYPGSTDAAGNRVRYIIQRMCTLAGPYGDTQCALYTPTGGSTSGSTMQVGATQFQSSPSVYYRITTRVDGPRNTVSITQTTVLITTAS
jgi:Tfp pilus assembly protein PilX